jgi:hypothetical protein
MFNDKSSQWDVGRGEKGCQRVFNKMIRRSEVGQMNIAGDGIFLDAQPDKPEWDVKGMEPVNSRSRWQWMLHDDTRTRVG